MPGRRTGLEVPLEVSWEYLSRHLKLQISGFTLVSIRDIETYLSSFSIALVSVMIVEI